MKKIITDVVCGNEFYEDAPTVCCIELSETTIGKIRKMHKAILDLNKADVCMYRISCFDYSPTWGKVLVEGEPVSQEVASGKAGLVFKLAEANHERTDCDLLRVGVHDFFWTCIPKYLDSSCQLESQNIPIGFLDSEEEVLVLIY